MLLAVIIHKLDCHAVEQCELHKIKQTTKLARLWKLKRHSGEVRPLAQLLDHAQQNPAPQQTCIFDPTGCNGQHMS